jgi:hypothetical protein
MSILEALWYNYKTVWITVNWSYGRSCLATAGNFSEDGFGLRSVGKMVYTSICYVPTQWEMLLIAASVSHKEGILYRWCKHRYSYAMWQRKATFTYKNIPFVLDLFTSTESTAHCYRLQTDYYVIRVSLLTMQNILISNERIIVNGDNAVLLRVLYCYFCRQKAEDHENTPEDQWLSRSLSIHDLCCTWPWTLLETALPALPENEVRNCDIGSILIVRIRRRKSILSLLWM